MKVEDVLSLGVNWVNRVSGNFVTKPFSNNFAFHAFWWFKHTNFSEIKLSFRLEFCSVADAYNYVLDGSICNKIYFLVVLGPYKTSVIGTTHISNLVFIVRYAEKVA